ncbi:MULTISPECIES: dienelactone hydrolase family protein [Paraburkholderia]|uniref:Alpha/beta hydrolase fold domain-containing protein n=1 Tax=Paraburkholderia podalyriae TaxID=1938811 RepID=A0ABR7Q151_9BURK|nr:dienelactone hydrolase family protein [Paraburkholderia podalyriae]MBC8752262.1 alpha/beta hydrolase fold domain-containing protein [Paraburkholderia podalyriae]
MLPRTGFWRAVFNAFCLLIALLPDTVHAQAARMEVIPFESLTLTDQEFLTGREEGKPVTIAGELRLPRVGNERFPLVVLLHGACGACGLVLDWERDFLAMGVATFVIDSFTSRGIANTNDDPSRLGQLAQTEDAYRALALLVKHPRIDPTRVMLMGFSRGGHSTLYASLTRFQRMHAAASEAHFAAYVAFYPSCNFRYRDDDDLTAQPVRVFMGTADNYTPIGACRDYVDRLKAKGKDVHLIEYQGAGHTFDARAYNPPRVLPQALTTRNCQVEEADHGQFVNAKTKQPFSYNDPCVERGTTLAYNEAAATQVRKDMAEFVAMTLKPTRSP